MLRIASAFFMGILCGIALAAYDAAAADLSMCGPFASVNARLEEAGETAMFRLVYQGHGEEPQTRIIFGNPDTHTYTVVVDRQGYACTMYNGTGFYAVK